MASSETPRSVGLVEAVRGAIFPEAEMAATVETHYVLVAPRNVGGPVLTAANLRLAACTPNFTIQWTWA